MQNFLKNMNTEKINEIIKENTNIFQYMMRGNPEDIYKYNIEKLKDLKIIENISKDPQKIKEYENEKRNKLIKNSFEEMVDPQKEQKKILNEYLMNPKTNMDIIFYHKKSLKETRYNKFYGENMFGSQNLSVNTFLSRTSSISMKLSKSNCNIDSMNKILIKNLKLERTHSNQYAILKIFDLPVKLNAIQFVLEDETGDLIILSLYNYEKIKKINNYKELDEEFTLGKYILVFEPYHKVFISRFAGIRVDNPEEIKLFNDLKEFNEYLTKSQNLSSDQLKQMGNECMNKKDYFKAKNYYEQAIKKDPQNGILYSNISEAFLKLNYNYKSLLNAEKAITILGQNHPILEKTIARKSRALYNLNRFEECKHELSKLNLNSEEKVNLSKELNNQCDIKINNNKGIYDFMKMKDEEKSTFFLDYADYINDKIKISFSLDKGVFISAKEKIKRAELICCTKAIVCYQKNSKNIFNLPYIDESNQNKIHLCSDHEQNRKKLIEIIIGKEEEYEDFFCLYDGENKNVDFNKRKEIIKKFPEMVKENSYYIINKLDKILKLNSFSMPTSILKQQNEYTGLWVFPSFFNHSCVCNSIYVRIGDFMILRASKEINTDEEISVSYTNYMNSYEERQKFLKTIWGFECKCEFCIYQKNNTINNSIKKYAYDTIYSIKKSLKIKSKEKGEGSNYILNIPESDYILTEKEMNEIFSKIKENPYEFGDYLQRNKNSFSRLEMSCLLYQFAIYCLNFEKDFHIKLLQESFNVVEGKFLPLELEILNVIISFYDREQDPKNMLKYLAKLHENYMFVAENNIELFDRLF